MAEIQTPLTFGAHRGVRSDVAFKRCADCANEFRMLTRSQRYCSNACRRSAFIKRRRSNASPQSRDCRQCGTPFSLSGRSANARYCCGECARIGRRRSAADFLDRHPGIQSTYNRRRIKDSIIVRLYKRYLTLPRICEAVGCNEGRVLEAAHKPDFRRNGAWRNMSQYERHMFWMLCPNHHELIDRGICTPAECGLP